MAPGEAKPECAACAEGPSGIAGHEQLFSQTMSGDTMHFRCRACHRVWVRLKDERDEYRWSRSTGYAGVDTPGRPGTAPP